MLKSPSTAALLGYWQAIALREMLQNISICSKQAKRCSLENIRLGHIDLDDTKDSILVWIAPWVASQIEGSHVLAPLWIGAQIKNGQLLPPPECVLPWINSAFFDLQNAQGTLFETIEHYDSQLLNHFFDVSLNPKQFTDWISYYEAALSLFHGLFRGHIKGALENTYVLENTAWVMSSVALCSESATPLLDRYLRLDESDLNPDFEILEHKDLSALFAIIQSKPSDIQVCDFKTRAPKNEFIHLVLALKYAKAIVEQKEPILVWVAKQAPELIVDKQDSSNIPNLSFVSEYNRLVEGLKLFEQYNKIKQELIQKFGGVQVIDEIIATHQAQDQNLEAEFDRCNERYLQWQKQSGSLFKNMFGWLSVAQVRHQKLAAEFFKDFLKEDESSQLTAEERIIEKMRQIKVARTKIHTELVELSQYLASKNGSHNRWVEWLSIHAPMVDKDNPSLSITQDFMKCFYKQSQNSIQALSLSAALEKVQNAPFMIDYLVVDNADTITPAAILPLLAQSQEALFLAQESSLPISACVSALYDNTLLKNSGLGQSEEDLEDLFYQGIHAAGSSYCVAKNATPYLLSLSSVASQPIVEHHPVIGEMEPVELSYRNIQEAQALLDWVIHHPQEHSKVAIVTLFQGQKDYLKNCLGTLKIEIGVHLLNELENLEKEFVLFSPVYTAVLPRPYLLDEGPFRLKKLWSCATNKVVMFADKGIFNPNTHTPSGRAAKLSHPLPALTDLWV